MIKLNNFYSSPNITKISKLRRKREAGNLMHLGEKINADKFLVVNP
jgi:hypothetical protein